jgi:hypothetical protein
VGDSDARVSGRGVTSGRRGVSGWGLSSERGASGTGAARRGGDDDGDNRPSGDLWEKWLSADLESDRAYIELPSLVTGPLPN